MVISRYRHPEGVCRTCKFELSDECPCMHYNPDGKCKEWVESFGYTNMETLLNKNNDYSDITNRRIQIKDIAD